MILRLLLVGIIIGTSLYSVASAANVIANQTANQTVIHIHQAVPIMTVYYGDVVNLMDAVGWTENISWWQRNHDPTVDPPDHIVTITDFEHYKVTALLEEGVWYQWYGENERSPVPVFYVMSTTRPANLRISPTPTAIPAPLTPVPTPVQPAPVADYLVARGDMFTMTTGECQVWTIGPDMSLPEGQLVNGSVGYQMELQPGLYDVVLQYPDADGVYEVFSEPGQVVNSTWKDVPGFWYGYMDDSVFKTNLMAMFYDTAHFHGRIEEKTLSVADQWTDVSSLGTSQNGTVVLRGTTNLAEGNSITAVWDADRNLYGDALAAHTFGTVANGGIQGAPRIFRVEMMVNLTNEQVGDHHITLTTPDGHRTTVEFYVSEAFAPFETPAITVHYLNNSPFIPVPTPVIITKEVPVTVIQTVTVPVTPPYEVVLQAQTEAAVAQRKVMEGNILGWVYDVTVLAIGGYIMYSGGRYLSGVVRRVKEK